MAREIWMASAEISPLARTGGLGEVLRTLPCSLAENNVSVRCFMPAYGSVDRTTFDQDPETYDIPLGDTKLTATFWSKSEPSGVTTTLVDCAELFDRGEIYGPPGGEYPDNPRRFAFFCRAVCELAHQSHRTPDVIHCHDWTTGLIPLFIKQTYSWKAKRPATVFSIHNLAYQGRFAASHLSWLSLTDDEAKAVFHPDGLEYYGDISFMKGGLMYADRLLTVSPTYAQDILTSEYGQGMEGVLEQRASLLSGILNGADDPVWDSTRDPYLPQKYGEKTLVAGKKAAKKAIQKELGLAPSDRPMLAMVGRFAHQKGVDIVLEAALPIIGKGVDLCIIGDGDPELGEALLRLRKHLPNRIGVYVGYDEGMAHLAMAGSDFAMVPSRYEPCGLTQMYAQKYGTIPIVHKTGGLADTVVDIDENRRTGTGISFSPLTSEELCTAVQRALMLYTKDPQRFASVQKRGMKKSFSWSTAAKEYLTIYRELVPIQPSRKKSDVLAPAVAR